MALRSLTRAATIAFQGRAPLVIGSRTLVGKARRGEIERPKPFPQDTRNYTMIDEIFDRTTTRWDDHSKVIIVDGAHAIGKTKFATELAEEFDMKLFGYPNITDHFVNYYGQDLNDYSVYLSPRLKPYDERDFARNPIGPVEGCGDRYHWLVFKEKLRNYVYALKHMYNTGQGVIIEGDPYSDYAHFEAAYNQGWVERGTRKAYKEALHMIMFRLMRPHLIVYLDAPADVVMKNIKARNNPWDKDSPVWTNKRYLNDIYNEKKRRHLMKQQRHSHVLVYDWSTPGDTDVVVDDIEKIEFDYTDEYDDLLRDWTRNRNEHKHMIKRRNYCNMGERSDIFHTIDSIPELRESDNLFFMPDELDELNHVMAHIQGDRFGPEANPAMGDSFWKLFTQLSFFKTKEHLPRYYEGRRDTVRQMMLGMDNEYLEPVKIEK